MSSLRVLFWMPEGSSIPGGHKVQMGTTAAEMRRKGAAVAISLDDAPELAGYDVVHLFGNRPADVRRARRSGALVAISSIYWARSYRMEPFGEHRSRALARARARRAARMAVASLAGPDALAERAAGVSDRRLFAAFEGADLLLPNSEAEAEAIRRELGVTTPCRVVPNGVDGELFAAVGTPLAARDTVLCLGRVEPHKNQLGVIAALAGSGLRVEVAGPSHPHHEDYLRRCRAAAGAGVELTGDLPHGGPLHLAALQRARVVVLASWFETTGLASLEGAAAGANVVTTDRGFASEYFGTEAWYCDPGRPQSIRDAVLAAWDHPGHPGLRRRVLEHFTWERCAAATLDAYEELLAERRPADDPAPAG